MLVFAVTLYPCGGHRLIAKDYIGPEVEDDEVQRKLRQKHRHWLNHVLHPIRKARGQDEEISDEIKSPIEEKPRHNTEIAVSTLTPVMTAREEPHFRGVPDEESPSKSLPPTTFCASAPPHTPSILCCRRRSRCYPLIVAFIRSLCTPMSLAIILSLPIAVVPQLKGLFVDVPDAGIPPAPDGQPPLAFLIDTANFFGAASVPLGLICLGSALTRLKMPHNPWSSLPIGAITLLAVSRLLIMPVLGVVICEGLVNVGMIRAEDKVLRFVFMLAFMRWSFVNYEVAHAADSNRVLLERMSDWLSNTGLFEQAWYAACEEPIPWWWSEQICLFTVGCWTVVIATEGTRYKIKHIWAYMLLGQLVAIAVASNLFYLALSLAALPKQESNPEEKSTTWARPSLWLSVLASMVTIALSPFASRQTFLPNLLVMHAAIVIPLLPGMVPCSSKKQKYSMRDRTLYGFVLVLSLATRTRTILTAASTVPSQTPLGLFSEAWKVLQSHPAQSSISWDVIWSTASFIVWIALKRLAASDALSDIPYLMLTSPLVSVGLTGPYILREELVEEEEPLKQG
ncbi:hypothetical protein ONZ45_g6721 [Pleurotus djamor]|nr:hypothetical protein ONZ45_g6721 [Pleurotus djamor]